MTDNTEEEKIIDELMRHFPNRRRHDVGVGGYTRSLSFALTLPLSDGANWALDNGSLSFDENPAIWRAIIHDYPKGYMTGKYNKNATLAVCKCWLAWKEAQDD